MNNKKRKPKLPGALNLGLAALFALFVLPLVCGFEVSADPLASGQRAIEQNAADQKIIDRTATSEIPTDVRINQVGDCNETIKKGYTPAADFVPTPSETGLNTEVRPIKIGRNSKIPDFLAEPNFNDIFGLNKEGLLKRFPSPNFKHKADFSEVTWHGTDVSSVLELRFKKGRVKQLRLSTHYGYPRPSTTSDVEVGNWQSAPVKIRR